MSLANYTGLQAAVASWLARSDLTSYIPDFVTLCESKLNRLLRCRQQEQRSTAAAAQYMELPTGFLELRSIELTTSPPYALEMVSPDEIDRDYSTATGQPLVYCLLANQIQLAPAPDSTYTVEIDFYEVIPPLASNSTNWLLTAHPDVYLYGSLLEASAFLQDDPRVPAWNAAYTQVLQQLQSADRRARWSGSRLAVRPA